MKLDYRYFREGDSEEIEELFRKVFTASEGEAEGRVIGLLAKDLIETTEENDRFIFVAAGGGELKGTIFATRMPSEKEDAIFLLAPVAVHTAFQGQGIGQQLIRYGINELRENGIKFLVTYGDPKFYAKVGFGPVDEALIGPPHPLSQPEGWLAHSLDGSNRIPELGKCTCVSAFDNPSYW